LRLYYCPHNCLYLAADKRHAFVAAANAAEGTVRTITILPT
jgi:hypothetical protein